MSDGVKCPRCAKGVYWLNRDTLLCAVCSDDEDVNPPPRLVGLQGEGNPDEDIDFSWRTFEVVDAPKETP